MPTRSNVYFIFLALLLFVEMGLFTFWRKEFDPHTLPFLFLGIQLLICILPLFLSKKASFPIENKLLSTKWVRIIPLSILTIVGVWLSFNMLDELYKKIAINPSYSDIIPLVQRFCKRALAGQFPYTVFDDFGYSLHPTYLPAQWMPYLPSEMFKFDPRYVTFWIFALTYIFFSVKIIKTPINLFASFILLALPVSLISNVYDYEQGVWSVTIEQLIMCYYLLLGMSLTTNSRTFTIITIVLCLMSRFSLLFWLPLYAFMLWTKDGWRPTLKFGLWVFAGCALLYGPFLMKDPYIFVNAQTDYGLATLGEWTRSDKPVHLYNGLGFALFFFEKGGDMVVQIASLKKNLFLITPSVSLLLGLIWWKFKDKLDFSLFAICTLKMSLAIFYAFIFTPYSYLFITPIFISLAVLYRFAFLLKIGEEETKLNTTNWEKKMIDNIRTKVKLIKFDYSHYIVFTLCALFFIVKFGISTLNFTNTNWVYRLSFDPGTEMISWNYFRYSPWSFPIIGRMEGYDYPTITGSGMTGIVSPLAIVFKLFSKWLPSDFQYFGWWFLLCFLLQGYFGLKLIKNVCKKYQITPPLYLQTLAVVFFIIAPPLLYRYGHINMMSHFFILAALAHYFDTLKTSQQKFVYFTVLSGICIGASQYITVMIMGIALASFVEMAQRRLMPVYHVLPYGMGVLAVVLFVFYLLGGFLMPFSISQSVGFGSYASNLNTFFNPLEYSKILPSLPLSDSGQYEGYGYLGLGFIFLLLFSMGYGLYNRYYGLLNTRENRSSPNLYPLFFMAFLFFIYALSCKIGWNNTVIHEWRYGSMSAMLFNTLRASGRFIWVPFYVLMLMGLIAFLKTNMPNKIKTILLTIFLAIQLFDIQKLLTLDDTVFEKCNAENCPHQKWKPLIAEAERVVLLPLYGWNIKKENDFLTFSRAASEQQKGITTGYFARRNMPLIKDYERKAYKDWSNGDMAENANAIFISSKEKMWRLKKFVEQGKLVSFEYDGYGVLVPPTLTKTMEYLKNLPNCRPLPFDTEGVSDFIKKHADKTIFVTASEEATYQLDSTTRAAFQNTGSTEFVKLGFAGAYMGVIHKGKMIFEAVNNDTVLEKTWKKGEILSNSEIPTLQRSPYGQSGLRSVKNVLQMSTDVTLASGGAYMGKISKTTIAEKNYSPNKRGLNFVVVNDKFEVIETTYFDTFEETYHAVFK